jgi:colanic acid/amylovoran biosynthesis glycosyltransferase
LNILLFTASYPYTAGMEQTFLDPEIKHLAEHFEKVILVPEVCKGNLAPIPNGIIVDETYASVFHSIPGKIRVLSTALSSKLFYKELVKHLSILLFPSGLKRLIMFTGKAILTRKWLTSFLSRNNLNENNCIFYTYWFDACTTGIGLIKKSLPKILLISRAHGYDLYEERSIGSFIPFRKQSLKVLDRLFCVSEAGMSYIIDRYPWFNKQCELARLGVRDPGFLTSSSTDGIIRIVSCSVLIPLKRVDLLLKGIDLATRLRPEQKLEWHHFGIGPLKQSIEKMASETLPDNVKCFFPGYPSLEFLMNFYKDNSVDLFMHVSQSEGGCPVAIQEALSCSIPIIATAAGGTTEIVSEANGILLGPDPSPTEIAQSIYDIMDNPAIIEDKKRQSKQVWLEKCNADTNHLTFISQLKALSSYQHSI